MVEVDVARYVQGLFTLDAFIMMTCCVTFFLNEWGGKGGEYEWSSVLQTSILVRHPPLQPAYDCLRRIIGAVEWRGWKLRPLWRLLLEHAR